MDVRAGTIPNALTVPDPACCATTQNNPYVYVQNPQQPVRAPRCDPWAKARTAKRKF